MKKGLVIFLIFITGTALSQESSYNQFSAEITGGIHIPFSPNNSISRAKYIGVKQVQLSGRYMFSEKAGLKLHYALNHFNDPNNKDLGMDFNRLGAEGVVNIGKLLNVHYTIREHVGLLFHTGGGLTFASSLYDNNPDNMINFIVGFTGQIKLNNSMALIGDMTYIANFSQQYGYNGMRITEGDSSSGSFATISLGIVFYLGPKKYHADWY